MNNYPMHWQEVVEPELTYLGRTVKAPLELQGAWTYPPPVDLKALEAKLKANANKVERKTIDWQQIWKQIKVIKP